MDKKNIGLTDEQATKNRTIHGSNELEMKESESFFEKLISCFTEDKLIKILVVCLVINVVFAFLGKAEWFDSIGIAISVLLATFISTWSEYSNESSFQKEQEAASKILVKVYRNGKVTEISIDDIVYDDLVLLETGDKVPADGYIIDGSVKIDQSTLNGESDEVSKVIAPESFNDYHTRDLLCKHKVFRGTVVVSGESIMRVTSTGSKTMYGELVKEMQEEGRLSPLQVKLGALADKITLFGYWGGGLIALAYLLRKVVIVNHFNLPEIMTYCTDFLTLANDCVEALMLAIIIVVMAAPEGLPMMIAMVLSQNMKKMIKDNVLVRKLYGIEAAGSLNVLFTDKTGTITKGHLEVVEFIDGNLHVSPSYNDIPNEIRKIFNISIAQNTTASLSLNGKVIGGNPTERAVMSYINHDEKFIDSVRIANRDTFSSDKKYSATQIAGDINITLYKGAPEKIIDRCINCYDENGNKVSFDKNKINDRINELASRAMRIIAIATSTKELVEGKLNDDLTLVGIVGIRDEVRPESIEAIRNVQNAGVQVAMITGDRKETAVAIAKEAGLLKNDDDIVLTSDELNSMTDDKLKKILSKIRVIARALPLDKLRLVKLAQELDLVVGMTGDGVNDSPALKKADVGFAMGSGTEVAKEAGDVIILDDNFNSIAKSILYGRTIVKSVRKFIIFQLTINVSAVITSFAAPILGMESPLSIIQILWVNLVMDTLAALAFGGEPALQKYMKEKPTNRSESIVSKKMWGQIITGGLYTFIIGMIFLATDIFKPVFNTDISMATGYFTFFIMCAVFNGFNARTENLNLFEHINENKGFLSIMAIITVIQVLMTFVGGQVLNVSPMNVSQWIVVLILAAIIIPIDLIRKLIIKNR